MFQINSMFIYIKNSPNSKCPPQSKIQFPRHSYFACTYHRMRSSPHTIAEVGAEVIRMTAERDDRNISFISVYNWIKS